MSNIVFITEGGSGFGFGHLMRCRALARALGCSEDWVGVATQEEGFGWRELN